MMKYPFDLAENYLVLYPSWSLLACHLVNHGMNIIPNCTYLKVMQIFFFSTPISFFVYVEVKIVTDEMTSWGLCFSNFDFILVMASVDNSFVVASLYIIYVRLLTCILSNSQNIVQLRSTFKVGGRKLVSIVKKLPM